MLDTAKAGTESYIMAKSILINGVAFDSVGVKYKGNSTYNANQNKNPFHLELDTYKNQDYQGYTDIKLSNVAKDPTFVREVLSYQILRQYMDAPLSNYANVYVNGQLIGLFASSESVSKKFAKTHFYSSKNPFFKCNPIGGAGPGSSAKPNLVYLGTDSSLYYAAYELNSDYGWKDLIGLCDTLKNFIGDIESVLDVDRALWMLAFDNTLVNLDSYIGGFAQNYYLYKDDNGRFCPVVWDLNESFGTFSQTGTLNLNNTTAKQQMTHLLHVGDAAWPLVQKLLSVPKYKRMYVAHMKTMLTENFANGTYYTAGQSLQSIINNAVSADVNKFYTYAQYQSNLTTDITGGGPGGGSTPGIKALMDGRNTYLMNQADFTAPAPVVENFVPSASNPVLNAPVTFTVKVTNASSVIFGYRFSIEDKFTKVTMYDDGAHGDGAAGDLVYGVTLQMSAAFMQYYLYAENLNAGIFSPARAEHEFFNLYAELGSIKKGELVINEIMADNGTTAADPAGDFDDWIELYNNTATTLTLDNVYLSDSYTSRLKWKFPDNTTIAPHGYLIVWADDDAAQPGLHSAFKLSATGEKVILSYANEYVIDSVSFGIQTTDVSFQRCPNGIGDFKIFAPSFNAENCMSTGTSDLKEMAFSVYPNPGDGLFHLSNNSTESIARAQVFNGMGQLVLELNNLGFGAAAIDISGQAAGMYFIRINDGVMLRLLKL